MHGRAPHCQFLIGPDRSRRPPPRPRSGAALIYRGAGSAAQPARSRELVGHPPAPGLVADEAVTASVMGVRGFPLASQRLGADAGVRRAVDALGDPPHLDQARLVPILDTPHDDLPARPPHPVVVAADPEARDVRPHLVTTPRRYGCAPTTAACW